jgi:hypothetical protein
MDVKVDVKRKLCRECNELFPNSRTSVLLAQAGTVDVTALRNDALYYLQKNLPGCLERPSLGVRQSPRRCGHDLIPRAASGHQLEPGPEIEERGVTARSPLE